MIKVENISKIYYKDKPNEIKAADNISLTFNNTGLVALFGSSGSGKTTLLNIIGGLDKPDSGVIKIDGKELSKKGSDLDVLRCEKIGYIFQNYNLIYDISVKENIKLALRLDRLNDDAECEKRTMYVLERLGISKYKNRLPSTLSGGQQQRVAIARALVKCPKIIIADEPTGNLDEKSTIATMDLLKQISKECLVILVTHEPRIVDFYADEVVELSDGKIVKQYKNEKKENLTLEDKDKIYLLDYNKRQLSAPDINIELYSAESMPKIDLKLCYINGKYYIELDNPLKSKIEIVNVDNETKLINDHKIDKSKEAYSIEIDKTIIKPIAQTGKRSKYQTVWQSIKAGFANMMGRNNKRSKWANFAFLFLALIATINISVYTTTMHIDEIKYMIAEPNVVNFRFDYINVPVDNSDTIRKEEYKKTIQHIKNTESQPMIWNEAYVEFYIETPKLVQKPIGYNYISLNGNKNYAPIDKFNGNLLVGVKSDSSVHNGIIVDEMFIQACTQMGMGNSLIQNGLSKNSDFIGKKVKIVYAKNNLQYFTIIGVAKSHSTTIWMDYSDYVQLMIAPLLIKDTSKMTENEIMNEYFALSPFFNEINVYSDNSNNLISKYNGKMKAVKVVDAKYEEVKAQNDVRTIGTIITLTIVLGAMFLIIYFVMRTETFNRVKQIGLLRCIGVSKGDVIKMFVWEIIAITLVTTVVGFIVGSLLSDAFGGFAPTMGSNYYFPFWIKAIVIVTMAALNLIFGLLPVLGILHKTPAEILAKYDI